MLEGADAIVDAAFSWIVIVLELFAPTVPMKHWAYVYPVPEKYIASTEP